MEGTLLDSHHHSCTRDHFSTYYTALLERRDQVFISEVKFLHMFSSTNLQRFRHHRRVGFWRASDDLSSTSSELPLATRTAIREGGAAPALRRAAIAIDRAKTGESACTTATSVGRNRETLIVPIIRRRNTSIGSRDRGGTRYRRRSGRGCMSRSRRGGRIIGRDGAVERTKRDVGGLFRSGELVDLRAAEDIGESLDRVGMGVEVHGGIAGLDVTRDAHYVVGGDIEVLGRTTFDGYLSATSIELRRAGGEVMKSEYFGANQILALWHRAWNLH